MQCSVASVGPCDFTVVSNPVLAVNRALKYSVNVGVEPMCCVHTKQCTNGGLMQSFISAFTFNKASCKSTWLADEFVPN